MRLQERPPPLPPPRAYTVSGGVKLGYPQQRAVAAAWAEEAPAGGAPPLRLRPGDAVLAVGAARRGHVAVQVRARRLAPLPPAPEPSVNAVLACAGGQPHGVRAAPRAGAAPRAPAAPAPPAARAAAARASHRLTAPTALTALKDT